MKLSLAMSLRSSSFARRRYREYCLLASSSCSCFLGFWLSSFLLTSSGFSCRKMKGCSAIRLVTHRHIDELRLVERLLHFLGQSRFLELNQHQRRQEQRTRSPSGTPSSLGLGMAMKSGCGTAPIRILRSVITV